MPQRADALRDLIFVLLGLETDLISREALTSAVQEWDCGRDRSLIETLLARGVLSEVNFARLDRRVVEYLSRRGDGLQVQVPTVRGSQDGEPDGDQAATIPSDVGMAATVADQERTLPSGGSAGDGPGGITVGAGSSQGQRFQVTGPHAKGGLGVVFRAVDRELNREVALKQIQERYADNPARRSRFLLEAEITGGLEHPGVVPVYGLGVDEAGRPYYAMRFIRGESLREAIVAFRRDEALKVDPGRRSLALRKLLRRLLDVCNTIEYAHGRGVIHRDIKPDNIMVGRYGETLVVDWGIAKLRGRPDLAAEDQAERNLFPLSGSGATETLPGTAMGTLAFMSPEQAAGEIARVGPASDVYSLGATLYQILTGRPAFAQGEVLSVLARVRNGEFPSPRKLDRSIPPALEAVCLKAMARKPEDRYPSARALGDDLERWMADEPVTAHREPYPERARRWMRRRRTAVTAAAVAMLAALVGLAAISTVQQKANRELLLANQREHERFDLAMKAIGTFHTGVSEDFMLRGKEFTDQRTKLLGEARGFYRELEVLLRGQTDRPSREALGRAYFEVGRLTARIDSADKALEDHRRALLVRESLAASPDATPQSRADLAASLREIALLEEKMGQYRDAEKKLDQVLKIHRELVASHPADAGFQRELARTYQRRGNLFQRTERLDRALAAFEESRALRQGLVNALPGQLDHLSDLAASDLDIGQLLLHIDHRGSEALESLVRSRATYQQIVAQDPGNLEYRFDLAKCTHALANRLSMTGQTQEATDAFRDAGDLCETLAKARPAVSLFQLELAAVMSDTANRLYRIGRLPEALAAYRRSRDIEKGVANLNPSDTGTRRNLALSQSAIGVVLAETGQPAEAIESFFEARHLLESLVNLIPTDTDFRQQLAGVDQQIGELLARNGRPEEALGAYEEMRDLLVKLAASDATEISYRRDLAACMTAIAPLLTGFGRPDEARSELDAARKLLLELRSSSPTSTPIQDSQARAEEAFALFLAEIGQPEPAQEAIRRARPIWDSLVASHAADIGFRQGLEECVRMRGDLLMRAGHPREALDAYGEALTIAGTLARDNPESQTIQVERATLERRRGEALGSAGRPAEGAAALRRSITILAGLSQLGAGDLFELATAHADLASLGDSKGSLVSAYESPAEVNAALAALRQAIAAGYRDTRAVATTHAFDILRARGDFPAILADLVFPVDPFTFPPPRALPPPPRP